MKNTLLSLLLLLSAQVFSQTYNVSGKLLLENKAETDVTIQFDKYTPVPAATKTFKTDNTGNL